MRTVLAQLTNTPGYWRSTLPISLFACLALTMSSSSMADYEAPRYTVERKLTDDAEIRLYEPMLLAEVLVNGDRGAASGKAFRILAGFIFGKNKSQGEVAMTVPVTQTAAGGPEGNEDAEQAEVSSQGGSEKIAMTAPVTQSPEGVDSWRVSFMMPSEYTLKTLPTPLDERILVYETEPYRAVALRFSGRHSDSNFFSHLRDLEELVQQQSLKTVGEPILAYYDAPFTVPFMRRNEVMLVLKEADS
ncbi:MAG: heme-binding protein [Pseudomonadota bacterium]